MIADIIFIQKYQFFDEPKRGRNPWEVRQNAITLTS